MKRWQLCFPLRIGSITISNYDIYTITMTKTARLTFCLVFVAKFSSSMGELFLTLSILFVALSTTNTVLVMLTNSVCYWPFFSILSILKPFLVCLWAAGWFKMSLLSYFKLLKYIRAVSSVKRILLKYVIYFRLY